METEKKLINFIIDTTFSDLPKVLLSIVRNMILTILGTTVGGATAESCDSLVEFLRKESGKEEVTILIYGGKIPAHKAVFTLQLHNRPWVNRSPRLRMAVNRMF
jgi:2-methylcitrate dehydratase PrpD